jgi:hypothetical protein
MGKKRKGRHVGGQAAVRRPVEYAKEREQETIRLVNEALDARVRETQATPCTN